MTRDLDGLAEAQSNRLLDEGLVMARSAGFTAEPASRRIDGPVSKGIVVPQGDPEQW